MEPKLLHINCWIFVPRQCAEKLMLREPWTRSLRGCVWNCRHNEEIGSLVLRLARERSGRRLLLTCFTWVRMTLNLSQTSVCLMWTPFLASQQCVKLPPRFVMTEVTDNRWSAYSSLMWEQRLCQNISLQQSERRIDYTVLGDRFPGNDVKTGPGGGFTDSRSRLLIAVNL